MSDVKIAPQTGPQQWLFRSKADIVVYGGAAGGGKTWSIIAYAAHMASRYAEYRGMILRRIKGDIKLPGGLWDEASEWWPKFGAEMFKAPNHEGRFPNGSHVTFGGCEHEKDADKYKGMQTPLICFDELTHFTSKQFWTIISRLRSAKGHPTRVLATTNPDADSWVRDLIDWWIGEDGLPIRDRIGKLRWYRRVEGDMEWSGERMSKDDGWSSITFIPAKLSDNKYLGADYDAMLRGLTEVEQQQLRLGNWNARNKAGTIFRSEIMARHYIDTPPNLSNARLVRHFDLAATDSATADDTASCLMAELDGIYYRLDVTRAKLDPGDVRTHINDICTQDRAIYGHVKTIIEQEGGASGKLAMNYMTQEFAEFALEGRTVRKNKVERAAPYSAAIYNGHVRFIRCNIDTQVSNQMVDFPGGKNDDMVDAQSGAYAELAGYAKPPEEREPIRTYGTFGGTMWSNRGR